MNSIEMPVGLHRDLEQLQLVQGLAELVGLGDIFVKLLEHVISHGAVLDGPALYGFPAH